MEKQVAARTSTKRHGRKRIELKLVKKKTSRMVTFSKRRVSIFGKASELSTLCNAHVAVMIFSPGGKIYSFGHPSVQDVVDRFKSHACSPTGSSLPDPSPYELESLRLDLRAEKTKRLKMELEMILQLIEAEKRKRRLLDMDWERVCALKHWWNGETKELNMHQCKELKKRLLELKREVRAERNKTPFDQNDSMKAPITGHGRGHLMPNNNFVHGWINSYYDGPFNSFIPASNNAPRHVYPMFNYGGGSRNVVAPFRAVPGSTGGSVNPIFAPNNNQYRAASGQYFNINNF